MAEQSREEWLNERRNGLGGSDIAAIMGLSPWKSRYQLYQDKKGLIPHNEENDQMRWGHLMEPTLRQFYSNETGRVVRIPEGIIYHKEYPVLFANPDGVTDDCRIVELKTARISKDWGEPGTAEIPDSYALQVQHYMLVTGYKVADVVVSIGGGLPVIYIVPADNEIHQLIIEEGLAFWKQVEDGICPEPESYQDVVSKFGGGTEVGKVYASEENVKEVDKLIVVKAEIAALEAQEDELKAKIITAIGEKGDSLIDGSGRLLVTYKLAAGRKTFDTKTFEKDEPVLYSTYVKIGAPSRRFLVK